MSLFDLPEEKFVSGVLDKFRQAKSVSHDWRLEAREDYKFYAGDQWNVDDRRYLEDAGRPIVVFNRVQPIVDAVVGTEHQNRQETTFLPRTLGETPDQIDDGAVSEMYTETARFVGDEGDYESEDSDAFRDGVICGMGWTEQHLDYEEEIDGKIRRDRFSPFEAFWDASAKKKNLTDARWVGRLAFMADERGKATWPDKWDKVRAEDSREWDPALTDKPHDADAAPFYENDQGGREKNRHKNQKLVFQYQWFELNPVWRAEDLDSGDVREIPEETVEDAREAGLFVVRQTRRRYYQAFVAGKVLLERKELHPKTEADGTRTMVPGFTLNCITGKRDEITGQWFGLVRILKDPQRWSNKFFSQIQDIVNSNAKGGIIAEMGAFENQQKAEEDWAKPDAIIWAADGSMSGQKPKIMPRDPAKFPVGLDRLLQFSQDAIPLTSGVNFEFIGLADRQQAGITEDRRIQQSTTTLSVLFDSLRRYRKIAGRLLLHMIRTYMPDKTLVRATGDQRIIQFRDVPGITRFDVVVDQSPTSPNVKEAAWRSIVEILPALMKAGLPLPPELLDYAPLPNSVIVKMKKFYAAQTDEIGEAQKKADLEETQAKTQKTKADAMKAIMSGLAALKGTENNANANQIKALEAFVGLLEKELEPQQETASSNE